MTLTRSCCASRQLVAVQHLRHAENAVERRADFVAHRRKEVGLRDRRRLGLLLGFDQGEFLLLLLVDIQHQPDGAHVLARRVALHAREQAHPAAFAVGTVDARVDALDLHWRQGSAASSGAAAAALRPCRGRRDGSPGAPAPRGQPASLNWSDDQRSPVLRSIS